MHDGAFALIALQVGLAALNIRGVMKNKQAGRATQEAGTP